MQVLPKTNTTRMTTFIKAKLKKKRKNKHKEYRAAAHNIITEQQKKNVSEMSIISLKPIGQFRHE